MKKISILVIAKGEPSSLVRLITTAIKNCDDPDSLQIVVAAEKGDRPMWDAIHKMYSKHPVELFSRVQLPTIKAVVRDCTRPDEDAYKKLADAANGYILVRMEDYMHFDGLSKWDLKLYKLTARSVLNEVHTVDIGANQVKMFHRNNYKKDKLIA